MRGLIDLVLGREPDPALAPQAPAPLDSRPDELRQIAARYRAIGAHDMAIEYESQADELEQC